MAAVCSSKALIMSDFTLASETNEDLNMCD